MKFYKVISEKSLNAYKKLDADRLELRANAKLLADEYDAEPIILQDSDSIWFCGIKFKDNSKVNREIWTKPSREYGHSWLRVKPLKKIHQEEFDAEVKKWSELFSKFFPNGTRVSKNDFYSTLGLDGSSFFFGYFKAFEFQNVFYIETSLDMKNAIEILGSEYQNAVTSSEKLKLEQNA